MYGTLIEEYFSQGKRVIVCIWHENQKVPAKLYVTAAKKRFPNGSVMIRVTKNSKLRNGDTFYGRTVIRYHFSGGASICCR
jgi:hypothetical protein